MAAKRIRNEYHEESDQQGDKRMRRIPSFTTVIREAVMAKYVQNLGLVLEPLIRRVVKEEVERGIVLGSHLIQRSQNMQLERAEPSGLQLIFKNSLSLPIFTGSKIEDSENNALEVFLVDSRNGERVIPASPIRIEILAIDGDFPVDNYENWTSTDFNKRVVKERTGRRPLITGDVLVTLREATALIGELTFTDNSSWIRSRQFRIGARVITASYNGPRIREALTEAFMVKDHRGEVYKKHYPPSLVDEVWRLDRIGKDGAFHKKLSAENINTVQDFLKLWSVDPDRLRRIMGVNMSDRMWEGTIGHAQTCTMGPEKIYIYRGDPCSILLNPICEVLGVIINGGLYTASELNRNLRAYVQQLHRDAYTKWDTLEEADGLFAGNIVPQNEMVSQIANGSSSVFSYHHDISTSQYQTLGYGGEEINPSDVQIRRNGPASTQNPTRETSMTQYW